MRRRDRGAARLHVVGRWGVRAAVLAALALTSVPLLASPASATEPIGGCWIWYSGVPTSDISSSLAPWANPDADPEGPADHKIKLAPSAPPAGSEATITYSYNKGPENAGPAARVQGTFRFTVNGGNEVSTTYDFGVVSTGQSIPGKSLKIPFTVLEGENEVVFEGVTFEASAFSIKIECNGQTSGTKAKNPRTDPEPTNVKASVTSSGTATGPSAPVPDPSAQPCLPDLPLPLPFDLPNLLPCPEDNGGDGGGTGGGGGGDNGGGDSGSGDGGGSGSGSGSGPGTGSGSGSAGSGTASSGQPAAGDIDFDCVLQPFNTAFDYKPSATVAGARKSAGAPVGLVAVFSDLPGIAPVPIDGPMEVTADLTVGGKDTVVRGQADVNVPAKAPVPVPDLTGEVAALDDTLPVTVTAFAFYFPSFDITGTCKTASGGDLGSMTVGSGDAGGGASSTGAAVGSGGAGESPSSTDLAPSATPDGSAEALAGTSQDLSLTDVRIEGSRSLGELFGAAPDRMLVLVVQNVGTSVIDEPYLALALGREGPLTLQPMQVKVGSLAPQQTQRIEIPMRMPRAAIGTYRLAGQVGTTANGSFGTSSTTYPWALFLLNLGAAGVAAWGLRRRLLAPTGATALSAPAPAPSPVEAHPAPGGTQGAIEDEATIDLAVLDRWFSRSRRRRPNAVQP